MLARPIINPTQTAQAANESLDCAESDDERAVPLLLRGAALGRLGFYADSKASLQAAIDLEGRLRHDTYVPPFALCDPPFHIHTHTHTHTHTRAHTHTCCHMRLGTSWGLYTALRRKPKTPRECSRGAGRYPTTSTLRCDRHGAG